MFPSRMTSPFSYEQRCRLTLPQKPCSVEYRWAGRAPMAQTRDWID